MRYASAFVTGAAAAAVAAALQFDVVPGAQHCFTEEIAPGTAVAVSYIVVDGAGELPITLQVRHVPSDSLVYTHDSIESGKFSFLSPGSSRDFRANGHQALPPSSGGVGTSEAAVVFHEKGNASSRENFVVAGQGQAPPSVGGDTVGAASDGTSSARPGAHQAQGADDASFTAYSFCFGKTLSHGSGLFHLFPRPFGGGVQETRRVIFELITGKAAARVPNGALSLARELHLTESDRLLSEVHAHVAGVVSQVDRMQVGARELDEMHAATGLRVTLYSILTCMCIVVAGVLSAQGTRVMLQAQKER